MAVSNVLADHGLPPVSEDMTCADLHWARAARSRMAKAFARYGKAL